MCENDQNSKVAELAGRYETMKIQVDCSGVTDRGRLRANNQDNFFVAHLVQGLTVTAGSLEDPEASVCKTSDTTLDLAADMLAEAEREAAVSEPTPQPVPTYGTHSYGTVLAVADGMGGHAAGDTASRIALEGAMPALVCSNSESVLDNESDSEVPTPEAIRTCLEKAIKSASRAVHRAADENPQYQGMGTTLTVAMILGDRLHVAHVGDSRCYLWRNGKLEQLTVDHTVAELYRQEGMLTAEEAAVSPMSHHLWNVVGGNSRQVTPDFITRDLAPGDVVLLATDGLTREVSDLQLSLELDDASSADTVCRELVRQANDHGGHDNITVVVARLVPREASVSRTNHRSHCHDGGNSHSCSPTAQE